MNASGKKMADEVALELCWVMCGAGRVCLVLVGAEVGFGETSASLRGFDLADQTEYGDGAGGVEEVVAASGSWA